MGQTASLELGAVGLKEGASSFSSQESLASCAPGGGDDGDAAGALHSQFSKAAWQWQQTDTV